MLVAVSIGTVTVPAATGEPASQAEATSPEESTCRDFRRRPVDDGVLRFERVAAAEAA